MLITPWYKPAELTITPYPFQLMMASAAAKKQQYDEGETLQGTIEGDLAKIKSIEIDTPFRDAELKKYQDKINGIVDKYKGDYGAMASEFKQIQREYNYNKNYGIIGAINNRYESRAKSVEAKNQAVDSWLKGKDGMSREDAQAAQAYEDKMQQPLAQDPKLGSWTSYYTENPNKTIDISSKALMYGKEMKPETIAAYHGLRDLGNGYYEAADKTITQLTPEMISSAVYGALLQDQEVANYTNWKYRVSNGDELVKNYIGVQTPEGYLGKDVRGNEVMRNPAAAPKEAAEIKNHLLTSDIKNASLMAGSIFKQYEEDRDYQYVSNKQWDLAQEEAKKKKEQEMYSFEGEGVGVGVDNSLGLTEDDFAVNPVGAVIGYEEPSGFTMPGPGSGGAIVPRAIYAQTPTPKTNPNTFTGKQKESFIKLLKTLALENPNDSYIASVASKYINGTPLTDQEIKDAYPNIQKIVSRTQNSPLKNNTKNVPLISITDPLERGAVNQQLGGSKNETLTLDQLGSGNSANLEFIDPSLNGGKGGKVTIGQIRTNHIITPNALVTVQMKINGSNPLSASTGNKNFADGYQISIEGKPYYVEGPNWSSGPLRVQKSIKINDATVGDASYEPDLLQSASFNDINYNFKYTGSSQNPEQGVYRVTHLRGDNVKDQSKKAGDAANDFGRAILSAEFTSASEVTQALSQYYILLNKK
jgi:hypothetical protein